MAENAYEDEVEDLSNVLYRAAKELPKEPRPFGAVDLTEEEQLQRYIEMREDVNAWVEIIEEEGLGPSVEYATEMEARLAKGQPLPEAEGE
jgi:Asp-tRNA(Asn)/Glu-tRNA(Gln) amidotransferase A subunit family amidase